MISLATRTVQLLPACVAMVLILIAALPWNLAGFPLVPNVVWLMSLTLAVAHRTSWPAGIAFLLGLLTDTLAGTPLGAQALLAVLITVVMQAKARQLEYQPLRVRWIIAACVLTLSYMLLWLIGYWVTGTAAAIRPMLMAILISTLWFPIFHFGAMMWVDRA